MQALATCFFASFIASYEPAIAQPPVNPTKKTTSILDTDRKLDAVISLEYAPLQGLGFFKTLWNKTGYEFSTGSTLSNLPESFFTIKTNGSSIRSLMESYATFYNIRWKKTKLGYQATSGNESLDFMFGADNPITVARYVAGMDFLNNTKNMSLEDRNRLGAGEKLPFGSFPTGCQNAIKRVFKEMENEYGAKGGFVPGESEAKLASSKIGYESKPKDGFTDYTLTFSGGVGGGSLCFTDYVSGKEKREAENDRLARSGKVGATFDPDRYKLTQKELSSVSALKKIVSISMKQATLGQVLSVVHEKYRIPILCSAPDHATQKANINLSSKTLLEALKSLQNSYRKTEWIWTRNSYLVVRGPGGVKFYSHLKQTEK